MALNWLLTFTSAIVGASSDGGEEGTGDVKSFKGKNTEASAGFQMPLHYPKYTKADYEKMEEWKVDMLLKQYGLSLKGSLDEKREFAIGAFLWPNQL